MTAKFMPCGDYIKVAYRPFEITLIADGVKQSWIIPIGFVTNLVSSPWWAQWYVPRWDMTYPAAILHDYLYTYHVTDRKEADKIFLLALEALGVSLLKRRIMYRAVRTKGRKNWKG